MANLASKSRAEEPTQNPIGSAPERDRKTGDRASMPTSITQKEAIERLIPYLSVLRGKGCSWDQITKLLNEKCGFRLKPSTVRMYVGDMARKHADVCRDVMADYLLAIAKIQQRERLADRVEVARSCVNLGGRDE